MKRTFHILLLLLSLGFLFNACSTDIDLYADYKEITVVYGLLDSAKDTNYVKINKAFLGPGNAFEIAMIADSCNYPGKLDAKLIEYRANAGSNNYQQTRVLPLDTITIHNKETGVFYAPDQLVYYTPQKVRSNTSDFSYRYELQIDRGDTLLTSSTDMVGGDRFAITTAMVSFSAVNGTPIKWMPCPNAAVYEVLLKFRFTEVSPSLDSVDRCMTLSLGTLPLSSLEMDHGQYAIAYKSSMFYTSLASFLGADTLKNVNRVVKNQAMGISISAGGDELYNFITVNGPSSSIVQTIPEYTNIKGGYGVFSSRAQIERWVNLQSLPDLIRKHPNWNFRQG